MHTNNHQLRERYHIAKLTLFNARLLNSLQQSERKEIADLIRSEMELNALRPPLSLTHQGTFLSSAYICLVWLWESVKQSGCEERLLNEFRQSAKRQGVPLPSADRICGPRKIDGWDNVLRLVRNALSHARVEIDEQHFVFSDQNTRGGEPTPTSLTLTWAELGGLSEACIHALTPILYSNS